MRTALVLSAGGMFGAYQAGVWAGLENRVAIDLVVGASVGSLNGWAIAGGIPAGALIDRWLRLEPAARPRLRIPKNFTDGFLAPEILEGAIRDIYLGFQPRIDIGLVVTELNGLRPRLLRAAPESWRHITWRHLAASCAVPFLLPQQRLDGRWFTDGGLVSSLPLWAALEMGATRILTVNVMPPMPLPVRACMNLVRRACHSEPSLKDVECIDLSPVEPLGPVHDLMRWRRDNAIRWIEQGRRVALERVAGAGAPLTG